MRLAALITHLKPPSSIGRIRLDRLSDNFDRSEELGLTNIRPWQVYRYVYPFSTETLSRLVYFFDFDYVERRDVAGDLRELTELVSRWQARQDCLVATRVNGPVVITDTRPVAVSGELRLDRISGLVYEFCDHRRTVLTIRQWLRETHAIALEADQIQRIVDGFVEGKLMAMEKGLYLSLAVMRHLPFDDSYETHPPAVATVQVLRGTRADRARAS
jgi:hypothetical protein